MDLCLTPGTHRPRSRSFNTHFLYTSSCACTHALAISSLYMKLIQNDSLRNTACSPSQSSSQLRRLDHALCYAPLTDLHSTLRHQEVAWEVSNRTRLCGVRCLRRVDHTGVG
jgi:hypothetical protein